MAAGGSGIPGFGVRTGVAGYRGSMTDHTAESFEGDDKNEEHAENVAAPDDERPAGIDDDQLPEDLQPTDDNPLAQDPEEGQSSNL